MLYGFNTDSYDRAKAALILYGIYRSRPANSPLMGVDTWDRYNNFIHAAWLKSSNTAEFVQNLCHKAGCTSIKPAYLLTGPVEMANGEVMEVEGVRDYKLDLFADDDLLPLLDKERVYLILLVRERIQREKVYGDQIVMEDMV